MTGALMTIRNMINFKLLSIKVALCFSIFGNVACSTLEGPPMESVGRADVVAKVSINSQFVIVKKDDTVQVQFSAIAVNDSLVVIKRDSVRWLSQDPLQVEVTSDGKIIGKAANNIPIRVILFYKHNVNTVSDTIAVYVTNTKYENAKIKIVQIDSNIVGSFPELVGLKYPRVRIDIYKDDIMVVKGAQIPAAVDRPSIKLEYSVNGGPDGEAVYIVTNGYGYVGPFWIVSSLNLYGNLVSDSVLFFGQYPVTNPGPLFRFVSTDEYGTIIPYSLDPLALEPQLQPCGVFSIFNFTAHPIDIIFSDSAEDAGECDPLPLTFAGVHAMGGNVLNIPQFGRVNRRTKYLGIISYYARDAVTKERFPVSGRYESISVQR